MFAIKFYKYLLRNIYGIDQPDRLTHTDELYFWCNWTSKNVYKYVYQLRFWKILKQYKRF